LSRIDVKVNFKNHFLAPNLKKMKKNLLFALSVFVITIVGLLVFCEASNKPSKESLKFNKVQQKDDMKGLASLNN